MRLPQISLLNVQNRLLASWLVVLAIVQVGVFLLIQGYETSNTRRVVSDGVVAGARIFERLLDTDAQRLAEGIRGLSSDAGFREAVTGPDHAGVGPALTKSGKKMGATALLFVDSDRRVLANTRGSDIGRPFVFTKLLDRAVALQQATALVPYGGQFVQLIAIPLRTPDLVGWIVAAIKIDDAFANEMRNLTGLDVSILSRADEGDWQNRASTLQGPARAQLAKDLSAGRYSSTDSGGNAEFGDDAVTRVINLSPRSDEGAIAVLQGRLDAALEPVQGLLTRLALISFAGLAVAIAVCLWLARGIALPIREITAAARRGATGDYAPISVASRRDEIGKLASEFRAMQEGVASAVSKLSDLAHRDPLTGLPSRVLFLDRLSQALAASERSPAPVSVVILSLDHFAHVNETLGHPIGDLLLREVAARLRSGIRRKTDTVARIGADEFAILLAGGRAADAHRTATAMLRALDVKTTLDGHIVDVRASIGIAVSPEHGQDPNKLLERADVAMHAAKHREPRIVTWEDRFDTNGEMRLSMMTDLKKAVDDDELALMYQPCVPLGDSGEFWVEALVRWQHPSRGLVPPSEFVPLAEQTGYMRTITQWVLTRAIAQCVEWRRQGLPIGVSINLSPCDLMDVEFPTRLEEMLKSTGCFAQWISLEVAENVLVDDPGYALKCLERFRALGCKVVIDDYGTGYSSVAYLRRLPVNELKLDNALIANMATEAGEVLFVRSTIELAHMLNLTVVANGVEDDAMFEQLRTLGCDGVQGFLLSRGLMAEDVPTWLRESQWARTLPDKATLRRVG